jgi:hypothetical protein
MVTICEIIVMGLAGARKNNPIVPRCLIVIKNMYEVRSMDIVISGKVITENLLYDNTIYCTLTTAAKSTFRIAGNSALCST